MKTSLVAIFVTLFISHSQSQISKSDILLDIDELENLIREKHVAPYWLNSEENINSIISEARSMVTNKDECDESCLVEFFKIVAAIKDGHSAISGGSRYELLGYYPISTRWFDGELRVTRAAEKYKNALGSQVVAVDGVPITDVLNKLRSVVPQANKYRFQKFAGSYLHLPGLLFGLGISKDPKQAVFSFQKGELEYDLLITDLPPEEEENTAFKSYLEGKKDLPLYQRNNDDYYWYNYDEDTELFYFQYNRVGNMKKEGSTAFATRMWKAVDSLEVNKFVLDLRYNGGGSFPFSLRYVQGILDRLDINRRGRLFIITGYDTFSAAMDMLNELELRSQAIIVGEYPCDHPSRPGDPEDYTLPNTGIKVYLSSLYHPTAILNDQRETSSLDKEITTTWQHYEAGIDPVMEWITHYSESDPIMVKAEASGNSLGSYRYSPTRNIDIKAVNGILRFEIARNLETPLYQIGKDSYGTEVPGMEVKFSNKSIAVQFPDGRLETYPKLQTSEESPVELLYKGDFTKARDTYFEIKRTNPDFIELKDHMMSFLANMVYFELRKYPDIEASVIAKGILQLGIELNNGNAPFCEYSLRFYQ